MYKIVVTKKFQKHLKKIDQRYHEAIKEDIEDLKDDPYSKVDKTKNPNLPTYHTRNGVYRTLLEIDDSEKEINIIIVRHRKEVYKPK